ncbi:13413_t:CDS:2, partial [Ambispora gerdemannii]
MPSLGKFKIGIASTKHEDFTLFEPVKNNGRLDVATIRGRFDLGLHMLRNEDLHIVEDSRNSLAWLISESYTGKKRVFPSKQLADAFRKEDTTSVGSTGSVTYEFSRVIFCRLVKIEVG